jgi:hypothetical protein
VSRCPVNGKRKYGSFGDAVAALDAIEVGKQATGRAYQCEHCEAWHITRKFFEAIKTRARGKQRKRLVVER